MQQRILRQHKQAANLDPEAEKRGFDRANRVMKHFASMGMGAELSPMLGSGVLVRNGIEGTIHSKSRVHSARIRISNIRDSERVEFLPIGTLHGLKEVAELAEFVQALHKALASSEFKKIMDA